MMDTSAPATPTRVFIDESGHTGEDLLNREQPIFSLASNILSDLEAHEIVTKYFSDVQSNELKHSSLIKSPKYRQRICSMVAETESLVFASYVAHKKYCLLSKIVDFWTEAAMHQDGVNLYEGGGNIATSNMLYFCIQGFESPAFLNKHLLNFQVMMREKTKESFVTFFEQLRLAYNDEVKERTQEILDLIMFPFVQLGPAHLDDLPAKPLDICVTAALQIVEHWSRNVAGPIEVVHDQSSSLAREKWLWDPVVSPDVPEQVVGYDDRVLKYPLRVGHTSLSKSHDHPQLQLCDVIAGATAVWGSYLDGTLPVEKNEYAEALEKADIRKFLIGAIWPIPEVERKPKIKGTQPRDPLEFLAEIALSAKSKSSK